MALGAHVAAAHAGGAGEVQAVVVQARFELRAAHREVHLIQIELAVRQLQCAVEQRRADGARDRHRSVATWPATRSMSGA